VTAIDNAYCSYVMRNRILLYTTVYSSTPHYTAVGRKLIEQNSTQVAKNPVHGLTVLSVPFLADHESKSVVAAPPIPLVADMTSGVKVACSTSHTLCSYCLLNLG